jgi:hypothetical protein
MTGVEKGKRNWPQGVDFPLGAESAASRKDFTDFKRETMVS